MIRFRAAVPLEAVLADVTTLDLLGLTAGTARPRLLDVAARRGADVLATDFAPGMVEVMRRRFAAEGLAARAEVMDGQALGLEDESFDLGTSTFVRCADRRENVTGRGRECRTLCRSVPPSLEGAPAASLAGASADLCPLESLLTRRA